ncbi:MAG TPA: 2'-5' RNA ligase family protein [Candidatus Saccharimonadales bacterium]|nr:2'-5' RNA ligase family protein [Candidatus Saccharimonadales bacterium]
MAGRINKYSLWLVPEGRAGEALQALVSAVAAETDTPPFVPHLTLVAHLSASAQTLPELKQRIATLAGLLHPIQLEFIDFGSLDEKSRSLFIEVRREPLRAVYQTAATVFPVVRDEHFAALPHISVLYGLHPEGVKRRLIQGHALPVGTAAVSALSLFLTEGTPSTWRLEQSFPLS